MTKLFCALAIFAANLLAQFPVRTTFPSGLNIPAAAGPNGHIWVAGIDRVARFDTAGRTVFTTTIEVKYGITAIAVDSTGRAAVTAERAVLSTLEAGCSAPLGALAEVVEGEDGEELWLRAVALSEDGGLSVRMSATGPVDEAARLGTRLASDMLDEGAADLMTAPPEDGPPVRNQHA